MRIDENIQCFGFLLLSTVGNSCKSHGDQNRHLRAHLVVDFRPVLVVPLEAAGSTPSYKWGAGVHQLTYSAAEGCCGHPEGDRHDCAFLHRTIDDQRQDCRYMGAPNLSKASSRKRIIKVENWPFFRPHKAMVVRRCALLELISIPPISDTEFRLDNTVHHCKKAPMKVVSCNVRIIAELTTADADAFLWSTILPGCMHLNAVTSIEGVPM